MNEENNLTGLGLVAIICMAVVAILYIGVFWLPSTAPPTPPDPSCTPTYQGDRICVAYVAETDCMCHAYSLGGLSCTPCKDLSPGVCP